MTLRLPHGCNLVNPLGTRLNILLLLAVAQAEQQIRPAHQVAVVVVLAVF
jgi:hypothetical protein